MRFINLFVAIILTVGILILYFQNLRTGAANVTLFYSSIPLELFLLTFFVASFAAWLCLAFAITWFLQSNKDIDDGFDL